MQKFLFLFFSLTVFAVLSITISTSAQIIYTPVEFRCNMSLQMKRGAFDRGDRVFVRINNAAPFDYELNDYDGDSVYSEIFWNFKKGQELLFIFTYDGKTHHYRETLGNRKLVVTAGANICDDYWNGVAKDPVKEILVNFSVSMDLERLTDLFNPGTDSVFISGNFNNQQKLILTPRSYQSDIYDVTISINISSEDTLRFSFFHSPDIQENVPIRNYIITFADYGIGHLELPLARFNQDPLLTPSFTVIFKCNLTSQMKHGTFSPNDKVFVRGNFSDWTGTDYELTDKNGDSIYTGVFSDFTSLQQLVFKFAINHNGKDTLENINNRMLILHPDINVFERAWEEVVEVAFNCNMSVQIKSGKFNPATDSVWVRGNFNDWAGKDFRLIDPDGDSIYSGLYNNFAVGQILVFKYVHNPDVWESTMNRMLYISEGQNVTTSCWEDVCIYKPSKIIKVAFSVNMELERLSGLFNPAINIVSVRGSFNGWGETLMTASPANADLYEVVTDVLAAVDEKISFKFFYSPGTWEVNNLDGPSQNDRYFIVTQAVYDSGFMAYDAVGFNNGQLETYCWEKHITFTCNTNGASIINAPAGTEFKTIHMAGGNAPLQWPGGGWPDQDITKVIQLYDDGTHHDAVAGDKIFSNEIPFPMYSTLNVVYKYSANWGLPTNGGKNDNETPIGGDKTLKMHCLTGWATVLDTFGVVHTTVLQYPDKVEKLDETPSEFALHQNYPNPFNPETVINYQLAASSHVTLKVFDVLGNEVAFLMNEEQSAGSYRVEFSSKNRELSSGVYFYQLRAGDFVQSKKMILLR